MAKRGKAASPDKGTSTDGEELDRNSAVAVAATTEPEANIEPEADIEAYELPEADSAVLCSQDPMATIVEAALTPEFEFLEELGKEGVEVAETAAISFAGKFRQLADESLSFTKEFLDSGYAFAGELRQATSPMAAVEVQIAFAKSAANRLLGHFLAMNGLYRSLLCQAPTPAGRQGAKAEC